MLYLLVLVVLHQNCSTPKYVIVAYITCATSEQYSTLTYVIVACIICATSEQCSTLTYVIVACIICATSELFYTNLCYSCLYYLC